MSLLLLLPAWRQVPLTASLVTTADLAVKASVDRRLTVDLLVTADLATLAKIDRNLTAALQATADLSALLTVQGIKTFVASLQATADLACKLSDERTLTAALAASADLLAVLTVLKGFIEGAYDSWSVPGGGKIFEVPQAGGTWTVPGIRG